MELKKTLEAVPDKTFSTLLRLQFKEGGNVPEKYDGLYKSRQRAKEAIAKYEQELAEKKRYPSAPTPKKDDPKPKAKAPEKKVEPKLEDVTTDGEAKDIS